MKVKWVQKTIINHADISRGRNHTQNVPGYIFALFALNLATAQIKTHTYILYMSPSMEQKSKIAHKKPSKFALNVHAWKLPLLQHHNLYLKCIGCNTTFKGQCKTVIQVFAVQ